MKKSVLLSLVIVVLLFVAFLFPITQKTNISISATFDNTVLQIIHLDNWKNWYPEIKKAYKNDAATYSLAEDISQKTYTLTIPGKKYIIHAITPLSYQVSEINGNLVDIFGFSVFPDTAGKMKISIVKKTPFIFTLFGKNNEGENAINGLKSYIENPKEFYGFKIEIGEIRDSIIASKVFNVNKRNLFSKIHDVYQDLIKYTKANNLIKTDHTSISYIPKPGDSLQITVGIPVNKQAASGKEINCLSLPGKGRVLVAKYEGRFSDRQKIYLAMAKYLTDHTLSSVAESFERYLNDSIPSSDSSIIRIELNFPVY